MAWAPGHPTTGSPALLFDRGVGGRFPVNELPMNFAPQRVDHGYLKVLVVTEALVAEVLGHHPAVLDRLNAAVEFNSSPVSQRNAIYHIEEKCLHCHYLPSIA